MEYLEKTTDLSEVTVKLLSHNVVLSTPRLNEILLKVVLNTINQLTINIKKIKEAN
jgi:hypothetical protein